MRFRFYPLLAVAALGHAPASAAGQAADQAGRVAASFALALGRVASADEVRTWSEAGKSSVADLLARHRDRLQRDADAPRAVLVRACQDAFGRDPTESEAAAWSQENGHYTERVQRHVQWLAGHPDDYRTVVERAYRAALHRAPYSVEFEYWRARSPLSFVLLVGAVEHWARRNAPGLMATTGTPCVSINSELLATVRLSPAIAREVRTALGFAVARDGCHVVAPAAADIVAVGGIHFVAVGHAGLAGGAAAK